MKSWEKGKSTGQQALDWLGMTSRAIRGQASAREGAQQCGKVIMASCCGLMQPCCLHGLCI